MNKAIIIKDGTSKSQLMKSIKDFEKEYNVTVLKMSVEENHHYKLATFDGSIFTLWCGEVDIFLNNIDFRYMRIESTL